MCIRDRPKINSCGVRPGGGDAEIAAMRDDTSIVQQLLHLQRQQRWNTVPYQVVVNRATTPVRVGYVDLYNISITAVRVRYVVNI